MESIVLKPEKEQRTLWILCGVFWFMLGLVTLIILMVAAGGKAAIVLGIILWAELIAMLLTLIWIPAFHASLQYIIDDDTVKAQGGVLWKRYVTIPFTKITNLDITQGPVQRIFGIGTIHVQTAGASGQQGAKAELRMLGVRNLQEVKERIMERIKAFTLSGAVQAKVEPAGQNQLQVLQGILNELVAIRGVLQSKGS